MDSNLVMGPRSMFRKIPPGKKCSTSGTDGRDKSKLYHQQEAIENSLRQGGIIHEYGLEKH